MTRLVRAALALLVVLALAGCGGLSREGPVEPGREVGSGRPADLRVTFPGPRDGESQESIVRGFVRAGAASDAAYDNARAFLTAQVSEAWKPDVSLVLLAEAAPPATVLVDPATVRITAKVADMENRFKICRAQSPVPGTTPRAGSARGVNLTHYMGPVVDVATYRTYFDKIKSKRDFGFDPDAAPIMSRRNPNEVNLDPSTLAFSATASVMGIRKNNAWKFYCHYKWSAIYHKQKPDTAGTAANDWALQTPIIASGIFEFSPATGHGIAL